MMVQRRLLVRRIAVVASIAGLATTLVAQLASSIDRCTLVLVEGSCSHCCLGLTNAKHRR